MTPPALEAHDLAELCDAAVLAHALAARLALDGHRELADRLVALLRAEGVLPPASQPPVAP